MIRPSEQRLAISPSITKHWVVVFGDEAEKVGRSATEDWAGGPVETGWASWRCMAFARMRQLTLCTGHLIRLKLKLVVPGKGG